MRSMRRSLLLCALLSALAGLLPLARAATEAAVAPDPILEQAIQTARAATPATLRARAFLRVAEACAQVGSPEQAREALRYAEEAAFTPTGLAGSVPLAVGNACLQLGFPAEALEIAAKLPLGGSRLDLTVAAADSYGAAGQPLKAAETMRAAVDAFTPAVDPLLAAQALAEAAARTDAASGGALLERAGQAAAPLGSRDRALANLSIASAYARLGDDAQALRVAEQIDEPLARARAVLATALELAARDEAAAVARVQTAAEAGRRADPAPLSQTLLDAAHEASDAARKDLTASLLREAERAASRADGDTRQTLLRNVANLHGTLLNDWPGALRVAEDSADLWTIRTCRARAAIQLAAAGQTERAADLFRAAAADKVGYIGLALIQGLGAAYFQIEPGAGVEQVMALQPQELRDQVLAAGARNALSKGEPAAALRWAQAIAFNGVSEDILYRTALDLMARADGATLARTVKTVRGIIPALRGEQRQHDILFAIGRRYAALGDMAAVQQVIDEFDKTKPAENLDDRSLGQMAILEAMLGHADQARKRLAEALSVADSITCGSCREEGLSGILADLLDAGDMDMLVQMVESEPASSLPARLLIGVVEGPPDLSAERRQMALRLALKSASQERLHAFGAEALAQVAVAWHKQGLTPGPKDLAVLPEPPPPAVEPEGPAPSLAAQADAPAPLVYFNRTGCALCRDVHEMMDRVAARLPNVRIRQYELADKDATLLNEALCAVFGIAERDRQVAPALFSAKGALIGREITEESLTGMIQAARGQPSPETIYAPRVDQAEARLRSRFESLNLAIVAGAGLFDGLNPCAFTVIIFFLSYLAFLGRNKGEIIAAGIVFTAAVFLTYLAVGIFLAQVIQFGQARSAAFSHALYAVTALVVLVAAVLSLRDGVRCLQGRVRDMSLVLPDKLKSKIRLTIARRARLGLTVGAMAVLGAVVALIEFPCTGQVYGPTIIFALNNLPQHRLGALGWLVLYNVFFIIPLIAVFIAVFYGLTSEKLTAIFHRHVAATKFALAGLFAVLFGFMVHQLF